MSEKEKQNLLVYIFMERGPFVLTLYNSWGNSAPIPILQPNTFFCQAPDPHQSCHSVT